MKTLFSPLHVIPHFSVGSTVQEQHAEGG